MPTVVVTPKVMSIIKERANNILIGEPRLRPDQRWQITLTKQAFELVQRSSQGGESLNDAIWRLAKSQPRQHDTKKVI